LAIGRTATKSITWFRRKELGMGWFSFVTGKRRAWYDSVNVASRDFKANPYRFYARLRAEAPVCRVPLPGGHQVWLVTRYDDVAMVLKDERFVKDTANVYTRAQEAKQPWFVRLLRSLRRNMVNLHPPDHTRLRALVSKAFTPRLVEELRERIQRLAEELLDRVQDRGLMDLIRDYALPMPTTIIAEMLGVPVRDRHQFRRWLNATGSATSSIWGMVQAAPNVWFLTRYIRKIIKNRRADPRDDLVTALVRAEEAGDTLSEGELVAMIFLLLVAGYETTVNLIGNGMLALLEHPDQMEKLCNDPALIKPAVEELLRYGNPLECATDRYAREDVTMGGVTIRRGEVVFAAIASANRDEGQFPNQDTLDITRDPNKHLSFGLGSHFCLGAPLARLEGQIAIGTLLRRVPNLRLAIAPGAVRWRPGLMFRGLEALPVAFNKQGQGRNRH